MYWQGRRVGWPRVRNSGRGVFHVDAVHVKLIGRFVRAGAPRAILPAQQSRTGRRNEDHRDRGPDFGSLGAAGAGRDGQSRRRPVGAQRGAASGRADIRLDTTSGNLSWTINYSGLSGPLTAAHFHGPAAQGANAGVIVPITGGGATPPLSGMATLSPQQVADVLAGRWYVNVHTAANPGGEIRGQVVRR
jgi:hypothetical protein